uniref:Uncharacterized protein n=1 Tax=Ditylenchus dipsaci TaxID=166011 RepID=A0A915CNH7_9BILA
MMLSEDSVNRRNSEGGSTVLAESLADASPNSSFGSPVSSLTYKPDASVQDQEGMTKLAKNLACSMSLGANDQFETAESVAENLRRASGSSLGSVGNTQMSSTSSSANMTNNSSAASSDVEVWTGQKQALSRLPVFERLSNGPF